MRKKILQWGLGSLLILFLAIVFILPKLIDSSFLMQKIQAAVSQNHIGDIDYEKAYLSMFPGPCLTLERIKFSAQERVTATVETLNVYPRLLPLFRGRLWGVKIFLDTPVVTAAWPDEQTGKVVSEEKTGEKNLSQHLCDAVAPLAAHVSGLKLSIKRGRIELTQKGQQKIEIKGLDLDADIDIAGPRMFNADLAVTGTDLTINRADKKVVIKCDRLKTALRVEDDNVELSLADFRLAQPALKLFGRFIASPDTSGFSLDLKGKDLDVPAIRTAALSLGGDNKTVVDTFSYLKGGRIPAIRIQSKSKKLAELGGEDNLIIHGRLLNGKISIDNIGMALTEVTGDALIANGILEASGASAKLGKTTGKEGFLKIGLAEDTDAFHLDIVLNARLGQVPAVLEKIMHPGPFLHELSLVSDLKGTATGRLVLGEKIDDIYTKIDISEMAFSAVYQRLPFPIEIRRGKLRYQGSRVDIENLDGAIGKSVFSEAVGKVDWKKNIDIDIVSGRLGLDLGEFYPWISSFDTLRESLSDIKEVSGALQVSALRLILPYDTDQNSDQWQLSAAGDVKKVAVSTTLLPEILHLVSGKFQAVPGQLSVENLNARLMDAKFDLTGTLFGNIRQPDHVKVTLNGDMGKKSVHLLMKSPHVPSVYAVHAPVRFAGATISWRAPGDLAFKGDAFFPEGVKLFSDFHYQPGELTVNRLDIKDRDSDASLAFGFQKNRSNMRFSGLLHNKTIDRIFVVEKMSDGWLKGDFQVAFVKGKLSESTLKGWLQGGRLILPFAERPPLIIDKLLFSCKNNSISVNRLSLSQGKNHAEINGMVNMTPDAFKLNLDASAGDLSWDRPEAKPDKPKKVSENQSSIDLSKYPISGTINLSAQSFSFGKYTWKPFHALISKDKDTVAIKADKANLCGIDTTGKLDWDGNTTDLELKFTAKDQDFNSTYECLSENQVEMSGNYGLTCQISARGKADELMNNAKGKFEFKARNGVITKDKTLSRILEVINFTEIVKGRLPDLKAKGFRYNTIKLQGVLSDNVVDFKKFFMDGNTMDLFGKGTLALKDETLDVELLAAPFKTVDAAIQAIPGVNYLMAGNLVSIPVRIRGPLSDPKVSIMEASDISSNFMDFAERVIKSPIKLIKSMNFYKKSKSKKKEE